MPENPFKRGSYAYHAYDGLELRDGTSLECPGCASPCASLVVLVAAHLCLTRFWLLHTCIFRDARAQAKNREKKSRKSRNFAKKIA